MFTSVSGIAKRVRAHSRRVLIGTVVGTTLIELSASSVVGGVGMLAATSTLQSYHKSVQYIKAVRARDELLSYIRNAATNVRLIQSSAAQAANSQLQSCLNAVDGAVCQSWVAYPFSLYGGTGSATDIISGTPNQPQRYSLMGRACMPGAPASDDCPIELSTSFRVQCPSDVSTSLIVPATCASRPEFVEIFYTLKQTAGFNLGNGKLGNLKAIEGSVMVQL